VCSSDLPTRFEAVIHTPCDNSTFNKGHSTATFRHPSGSLRAANTHWAMQLTSRAATNAATAQTSEGPNTHMLTTGNAKVAAPSHSRIRLVDLKSWYASTTPRAPVVSVARGMPNAAINKLILATSCNSALTLSQSRASTVANRASSTPPITPVINVNSRPTRARPGISTAAG